jgi:hypothetical protein
MEEERSRRRRERRKEERKGGKEREGRERNREGCRKSQILIQGSLVFSKYRKGETVFKLKRLEKSSELESQKVLSSCLR